MRKLLSLFFVTVLVSFYARSAEAAPQELGTIVVTMVGFRSDRGHAMVALWRGAKGFPGTPPVDAPSSSVSIAGGRAVARFEGVEAGDFAITVFHDEDGDTELKENFLGMPKEGIGFSRDVRPRFRAPRFEQARLELAPGREKRLTITMFYL